MVPGKVVLILLHSKCIIKILTTFNNMKLILVAIPKPQQSISSIVSKKKQ